MTVLGCDGSFKAGYEYSDFGETSKYGDENFDNEVCYTGGIYDESTELYYLNARYYDPANSRFLSQDTYRGENTDPSSLHLYAYCASNPINFVDPSGHKKYRATKNHEHFNTVFVAKVHENIFTAKWITKKGKITSMSLSTNGNGKTILGSKFIKKTDIYKYKSMYQKRTLGVMAKKYISSVKKQTCLQIGYTAHKPSRFITMKW